MESNIKIKDTPKLKISSAIFGDRKKFSKLEKKISVNSEKITRIKKIIQTQKGNVGKKLPGGSNVNQSIVETNKILVEIQKQIATAFGIRNEEEKEKNKTLKQEKSREKLRLKEGVIESVRKIGGTIKKTVGGLLKPVGGIFDKIMKFLSILGTGIAANAVFGWLSDEENKSKLMGWFDFIKEHWKWGLAALGGIALLNIVGPISAVLGVIKVAVGLLAKGIGPLLFLLKSPAFLAAAGIGGGIAATLFGMKAAIDFFKRKAAGGEDFYNAYEALKGELAEEGITVKGSGKDEKFSISSDARGKTTKTVESDGSEKQKKMVEEYITKRDSLIQLRKQRDDEIESRLSAYEPIPYTKPTGSRSRFSIDPNIEARKKIKNDTTKEFGDRIEGILKAREMGGPVSAKTPYLVGESGPEIFAPNVDGSIINNMRTEKIYQMISSKGAGKINFITMELPPKVMKKEQPVSDQQTVPPVPSISPVNGSNPYMNITPEIYGIYV